PSTHELEKIYLEDGCAHKKGVIAKFIDVDDRDLAANLLNQEIWVDENELPELEDGDYYWHQLIGLEVFNTDDNYIGNVKNLLETGANDVLIVRDDEQSEYLIPYIKEQVIKSIDLDAKRIVVDWDKDF
ncbi:MAG: ribosome maturation factor RimM, partial [Pseudomonadota bacterium]